MLELLDNPATLIAVVGATDNPSKFGYAIYRELKRKGFRVFPVNPGRSTVDGDCCYPKLGALPERPDIVNLVIPPEEALDVLRECRDLKLLKVWLQPGAENAEIMEFLDANGFDYLAQTCIMVKTHPLRA